MHKVKRVSDAVEALAKQVEVCLCMDMRMNMCVYMCMDMCMDICIHMCTDMYIVSWSIVFWQPVVGLSPVRVGTLE